MSLKVTELPSALLAAAAFVIIVAGIQSASAIVSWVLGPIGMLLSVPLTMIAKIALATN